MGILIFIIGFLVGFFVSSLFFQFIIEDVVHSFTYGDVEYEKRENKK